MAYIRNGFGDYGPASNEPYFPFSPNKSSSGGGCGCGGTCGGCGGHDHGMGYFTSMDPSTWGVPEWGTIAAGLFVGAKVIGSHPVVKRAGKKAKGAASKATSSLGTIAIWGAAAYGAYWLYTNYASSTGVSGFGDYQAQGYTGPQQLTAPLANADIMIPAGW
jgi:hypothetical protein